MNSSCCSACVREDLKHGALITLRWPLSLYSAIFHDSCYLSSILHIGQVDPKITPWYQLWLYPACVAEGLLRSPSGLSHHWENSSSDFCIELNVVKLGWWIRNWTLKAPSRKEVTNAHPFKLKFLFKPSSCFSIWMWLLHPTGTSVLPDVPLGATSVKLPNGWYHCAMLCVDWHSPQELFPLSLNKKPLS